MTELECPECATPLSECGCEPCEYCARYSPDDDKREALGRNGHTVDYCKYCADEVEVNARHASDNGELIIL